MRRIISENRVARERAERLTSRATTAIQTGQFDELSNIVRDASKELEDGSTEGGVDPLEAGDVEGRGGDASITGTPG